MMDRIQVFKRRREQFAQRRQRVNGRGSPPGAICVSAMDTRSLPEAIRVSRMDTRSLPLVTQLQQRTENGSVCALDANSDRDRSRMRFS